ncbi:MAG: nucleoside transporter C-terminal domain-containing protein [Planctomycetota bacterium]
MIDVARGIFGIALVLGLAWAMSSHKRALPWRIVLWGIGLQLILAGLVLGTGVGQNAMAAVASGVQRFVQVNTFGAEMLFNDLADSTRTQRDLPEVPGSGFLFAFAATGLLVIIFFSALMSLLYHLGVMQVLVWLIARVMMVTMGVSGAEAMAMAANMFVGQTEAPLVVKPYLPDMTKSELNAMMTGGFATVAGSVLVVYMSFFSETLGALGTTIGPHLLTASVLSAPAAFVIAKIVLPETQTPRTAGAIPLKIERTADNLVEAAANGTTDGLKLYLNVVAMLLAFTALVKLVDWPLGAIGAAWFDLPAEGNGALSLAYLLGYLLAPLAWTIGVNGWTDCRLVGGLIGLKLTTNEFVAFGELVSAASPPTPEQIAANPQLADAPVLSERGAQLVAYALCGFANFASVGIQIGGITPLAPERKTELSRLAVRAMLGGALASACTAAVAGMFL